MITTRQLLALLRQANPHERITEHRLRSALRWGDVPQPTSFAGRYAWTLEQVRALAAHLELNLPDTSAEDPHGPSSAPGMDHVGGGAR